MVWFRNTKYGEGAEQDAEEPAGVSASRPESMDRRSGAAREPWLRQIELGDAEAPAVIRGDAAALIEQCQLRAIDHHGRVAGLAGLEHRARLNPSFDTACSQRPPDFMNSVCTNM